MAFVTKRNDSIGGGKYNVVYYSTSGKVRIGVTPKKEGGKKVMVNRRQVYTIVVQEKPVGSYAYRYTYVETKVGLAEMTKEVQKLLRKYKNK